jgi:hypothetical protein
MSEKGTPLSLAAMVRANRPWRLLLGLAPAGAAAAATGAYALLTSEVWQLADRLPGVKLAAMTLLSIAAMAAWLIVDHELWERPSRQSERPKARLNNAATVITVGLGVVVMYVAVFAVSLGAEWVVLEENVVRQTVNHPIGWTTLIAIAWMASSIATVGGAIGSGLESDEDVRAAIRGQSRAK